jgi:hypothetical protein
LDLVWARDFVRLATDSFPPQLPEVAALKFGVFFDAARPNHRLHNDLQICRALKLNVF